MLYSYLVTIFVTAGSLNVAFLAPIVVINSSSEQSFLPTTKTTTKSTVVTTTTTPRPTTTILSDFDYIDSYNDDDENPQGDMNSMLLVPAGYDRNPAIRSTRTRSTQTTTRRTTTRRTTTNRQEEALQLKMVDKVMAEAVDSMLEEEFIFQRMILQQQDKPDSISKSPPPSAANRALFTMDNDNDNGTDLLQQLISSALKVRLPHTLAPPVGQTFAANGRTLNLLAQQVASPTTYSDCVSGIKKIACDLVAAHIAGSLMLMPFSATSPLMSDTRDSPFFMVSEACLYPTSIQRRRHVDDCQLLRALMNVQAVGLSMEKLKPTPEPVAAANGRTFLQQSFGSRTMGTNFGFQLPSVAVNSISLDDEGADFICGTNGGFNACDDITKSCEVATQLLTTATTTMATRRRTTTSNLTTTSTTPNYDSRVFEAIGNNRITKNIVRAYDNGNKQQWFSSRKCGADLSKTARVMNGFLFAAESPSSSQPFQIRSVGDVTKVQQNVLGHFDILRAKLQKYLGQFVDSQENVTGTLWNSTFANPLMNPSIAIGVASRASRFNRPAISLPKIQQPTISTRPTRAETPLQKSTPPSSLMAGTVRMFVASTTSTPPSNFEAYDGEESPSPCSVEVQNLARTLLELNNNGAIWLSWFVLEDEIYQHNPPNVDASPLSTILHTVVGQKAPLYTAVLKNNNAKSATNPTKQSNDPSSICVPAQTLRNLIRSATEFYADYGQPFYVQSIVGSPKYNGTGLAEHGGAVGADLQCGQAIYDSSLGVDCNKLMTYCYKGFKNVVMPAYNFGCGERWWPVDAMHCAD